MATAFKEVMDNLFAIYLGKAGSDRKVAVEGKGVISGEFGVSGGAGEVTPDIPTPGQLAAHDQIVKPTEVAREPGADEVEMISDEDILDDDPPSGEPF